MSYNGLTEFIAFLEKKGDLIRIKKTVSPHLEMTEIADRFMKKGGPAILFENNGTGFPVLLNAYGTRERMAGALGISGFGELDQFATPYLRAAEALQGGLVSKIKAAASLRKLFGNMPVISRKRGRCQEVVMAHPDLGKLPVMTCWPYDGGPFITLPMVHTRHPVTGKRNVGMYRMQVFSATTTGMHWHKHKDGAGHFRDMKKSGGRMPVSVCLGGDPVYAYCASAPLPEGLDEYMLAGILRGKPVRLVKCLSNDLEVPEDADIVIEGYVDTDEEPVTEGPFGDHTGFYSLPDLYPVFHVSCITHRKNAVYPSTIVGIPPMEDYWLGKTTERIFLHPIKLTVAPEISDMNMPAEGVFHNIAVVKIKKHYPGQAEKVMHALWGAGQMMFNKYLVVAGDDCEEPADALSLLRLVSENVKIPDDIIFSRGPADVLDHAVQKAAFGGKAGIDATEKKPADSGNISPRIDSVALRAAAPGIKFNDSLLQKGIKILLIGCDRKNEAHIKELHTMMVSKGMVSGIKLIVYTDLNVPLDDGSLVCWLAANNTDPARDIYFAKSPDGQFIAGLDATAKENVPGGFERPWPEPVVMNDETISLVDTNWPEYNAGILLPSPSLRYKSLVKGNKASVSFKNS